VENASGQNQRIFALAFHVDYWNYLGWKDVFSDQRYSDRQRKYADIARSGRIYTPQMIVNGTQAFGGSDRGQGTSAIQSALKQPAEVSVKLESLRKPASDTITVEFEVANAPEQSVLHIGLVERGIIRQIQRGENAGRKLKHENVVRAFQTVDSSKISNGRIELPLPTSVNLENASIVGYVQNNETMEILGATGIDL
jgi:hypothetical protein